MTAVMRVLLSLALCSQILHAAPVPSPAAVPSVSEQIRSCQVAADLARMLWWKLHWEEAKLVVELDVEELTEEDLKRAGGTLSDVDEAADEDSEEEQYVNEDYDQEVAAILVGTYAYDKQRLLMEGEGNSDDTGDIVSITMGTGFNVVTCWKPRDTGETRYRMTHCNCGGEERPNTSAGHSFNFDLHPNSNRVEHNEIYNDDEPDADESSDALNFWSLVAYCAIFHFAVSVILYFVASFVIRLYTGGDNNDTGSQSEKTVLESGYQAVPNVDTDHQDSTMPEKTGSTSVGVEEVEFDEDFDDSNYPMG